MEDINNNGWELFLHKKPAEIILSLQNAGNEPMYASVVSKCVDCTYPHTLQILKKFESKGLVVFNGSEKDERIKIVELTEEGKSIAHDINVLIMRWGNLSNLSEI